jgi:tetratricopeptide (TPR) repeat protein
MTLRTTALACAVALGKATVAIAAPTREPVDERELQAMRVQSPHAVDLLEKGEALAAAGSLKEADALFLQAQAEYSRGSLLFRRDCEARAALGQRKEAIEACSRAVETAPRSDPNVRALVSALVDGSTPPSMADLVEALTLTAQAHDRTPGLPTAAATACDIAERIGDRVMLQQCTEELQRIAPNDAALRRAQSVLSARCPPWRFWSGWLALAAAAVFTLGHALRRFVRRSPGRRSGITAVAALAMILCGLAAPRLAAAEEGPVPEKGWLSKWPIDPQDPSKNIPSDKDKNADPLEFGYWLQDVAWKAAHASKKGDHEMAAKLYGALADAVPDRAIGFTMACQEYETLGQLDRAINACGQGLLRDGTLVKDFVHFVRLVLAKPGPLGKKEIEGLAQVVAHMRDDPASRDFADDIECQIAVRTSNVAQLRECTAGLVERGESGATLLSYQWNLAILETKFGLARQLVERAKLAGMPAENAASMLKTTSSRQRLYWGRVFLGVLALGLLGAGIRVALKALRQRRGPPGAAPSSPGDKAAIPV